MCVPASRVPNIHLTLIIIKVVGQNISGRVMTYIFDNILTASAFTPALSPYK